MNDDPIKIQVVSDERMVLSNLIEGKQYRAGESSKKFETGSELVYEGAKIRKGVGGPEIYEFSLYVGQTAIEGAITHYLIQRVKDFDVRIIINGEEVEADEESVQTKLEQFED